MYNIDRIKQRLEFKVKSRAKEIGKRIREKRIESKYSQGEFAKIMGYSVDSRQIIGDWECGKKLPELGTFLKMCDLFDCEMGYLLGEEGYECKTRAITDIQKETGLSTKAIEKIRIMKEINEQQPKIGQIKMLSDILENMVTFSGLLAQMNLYLRDINGEPPSMDSYLKKTTNKEPNSKPPFDALFLSEELRKMGYVVTTPKEFSRIKFEECTEILKKLLDQIAAGQKEDVDNGDNNKAGKQL